MNDTKITAKEMLDYLLLKYKININELSNEMSLHLKNQVCQYHDYLTGMDIFQNVMTCEKCERSNYCQNCINTIRTAKRAHELRKPNSTMIKYTCVKCAQQYDLYVCAKCSGFYCDSQKCE